MPYHTGANGSDSGAHSTPAEKKLLLNDIPDDYGLLLWMDASSSACYMTYCPDENYGELHPNIYAPSGLENVRALCGGGSGVTVFEGDLPFEQHKNMLESEDNRTVVMKHGSHKDTKELFALATIAHQLERRCQQSEVQDGILEDMQGRIPQFQYLYLSPKHFCERHRELWDRIKQTVFEFQNVKSRKRIKKKLMEQNGVVATSNGAKKSSSSYSEQFNSNSSSSPSFGNFLKNKANDKPPRGKRVIRIYAGDHADDREALHSVVTIQPDFVNIILDDDKGKPTDSMDHTVQYGLEGHGYAALKSLVSQLLTLQQENSWKFTCGQTRIGGELPQTASSLLVKGHMLRDNLLPELLDEFVNVVTNLQRLTLPRERPGVKQVAEELEGIKKRHGQPGSAVDASCVSSLANSFVGGAIRKNFHPVHSRFIKLKRMGAQFRSNDLVLQEAEIEPANFLGLLLQKAAQMNHVFVNSPAHETTIFKGDMAQSWISLLEDATRVPENSAAADAKLNRVWTCGFTDAGLHNLFLNKGKLWLFDLGEPSLQPLPAFLTKFLFSFFHTLGMEEDSSGNWIRRFKTVKQKRGSEEKSLLALTDETKQLLAQSYNVFDVVLDRFVKDLFHGDETIRPLLIAYVTYQLVSDASFCVEKWTIKGGGQEKHSSGHAHAHNEKWLWRALWDLYAAFDINTKTWI